MDLVGSIKYMENRLGGRKHSYKKGKPAQKNTHSNTVEEQDAQSSTYHPSSGDDARLGQKVNVTA